MNYLDRLSFECLVKPILRDNIDFECIRHYLNCLGVDEKLPESTPHLNYASLNGPTIRLFNLIIEYMQVKQLDSVEDFLGIENIEKYSIVSKSKNHQVSIIHVNKLRDILRNAGIIPFGEDILEEFQEFLSLNDEFDELIMINKFKKSTVFNVV